MLDKVTDVCAISKSSAPAGVFAILGILLSIFLGVSPPTMAEETSADLQVVRGNGQFTQNMYNILKKKPGNVFFSPISAHAVLSMAYQGSKGNTEKAFSSTLGIKDTKAAADGYKEVMTRLNSIENVTLLMANKVYIMNKYNLEENFKNAVVKSFLSEVEPVDFSKNTETAQAINGWVEDKTKNKIKDLISPGDLDALTRLVLVNAIYFKGDWKYKFDSDSTRQEPFYINENDFVEVPMMHIKKHFHYKEDDNLDAKILEMPYKNEDVSLIIILPNERNGIDKLEQKLAEQDLTTIAQEMWSVEVEVSLPKFKIEQTIDLKDTLIEMGLGEIFDENKANFTGMITADEQLYVSKVIQKAFIEVNEEGAEAAAATGIGMVEYSLSETSMFVADHPFSFALVQNRQNNIHVIFRGRMSMSMPDLKIKHVKKSLWDKLFMFLQNYGIAKYKKMSDQH